MARHNEVMLYGQVLQEPRLYYDAPETDPHRKLIQTIGFLAVMRGIRDFGAVDKRIRIDIPIVLSRNEKIMKVMKQWEVGDIIFVKGTLATANNIKNKICPVCNEVERIPAMLAFVNPIFMETRAKGLSSEDGNNDIRRHAEISNHITILGKACREPVLFPTSKGQHITNYQLDVPRKYRIKEDDDSNRHDFPFVKSYGFVADNDNDAIKLNGLVFVDGALQTREYTKKRVCEHCGSEFTYQETATEIIPYSTEYLTGCRTMEEIEQERRLKSIEEGQAARKELFGDSEETPGTKGITP